MRAAVLHELRTVPVFGDFKEPQPDAVHQVADVVLEVERLPLSRIADAWEMQDRGPHHKITLVP
jgi:hypothetical protein